jgi:uncharacterized repeat protein (TIGR04042 family)
MKHNGNQFPVNLAHPSDGVIGRFGGVVPEVYFRVSWPDGSTQRCYSPSLVVEEFFEAGQAYPVVEFVDRSTRALGIASDRVRERYGFACSQAAVQLAEIRSTAGKYSDVDAKVIVEGFER